MLSDCEALHNPDHEGFKFTCVLLTVCAADATFTPQTFDSINSLVWQWEENTFWLFDLAHYPVQQFFFCLVFKHLAVNVSALSAHPIISSISPPHSEPLEHQPLLIMNVWSDVCLPSNFPADTSQPFALPGYCPALITNNVCVCVCLHIYIVHTCIYKYICMYVHIHMQFYSNICSELHKTDEISLLSHLHNPSLTFITPVACNLKPNDRPTSLTLTLEAVHDDWWCLYM